MKIVAIIILSCCVTLAALGIGLYNHVFVAATAASQHNHPLTPLLYEDFENPTGYDLAGWGEQPGGIGVIDEDYTATVLYGTQSLLLDEDDDNVTRTTNSFAANGHVWVSFRLRITKMLNATDSTILRLNDSSDNCQFELTINADGDFKIRPGCGASVYQTGFGPVVNTTYTVWIEYWNDNGANSYTSLAFSTGSIRPTSGDNFVDGTGVSTATEVSMIQIGHSVGGQEVDFIMDHLLVDDVQIGDWP